jgi:hypothetical protein
MKNKNPDRRLNNVQNISISDKKNQQIVRSSKHSRQNCSLCPYLPQE